MIQSTSVLMARSLPGVKTIKLPDKSEIVNDRVRELIDIFNKEEPNIQNRFNIVYNRYYKLARSVHGSKVTLANLSKDKEIQVLTKLNNDIWISLLTKIKNRFDISFPEFCFPPKGQKHYEEFWEILISISKSETTISGIFNGDNNNKLNLSIESYLNICKNELETVFIDLREKCEKQIRLKYSK